jgi:phosphatidylserine decarboxylase
LTPFPAGATFLIDMLLLFAKYGRKELFVFTAIWALIGLGLWFAHPLARYGLIVPLAGILFTLNFFRDPARRIPQEPGILVAPADGTVTEISEAMESDFLNVPCTKIGIFLSVFDVHINRAPCDGVVHALKYRPGKFLDARDPRCGAENEANSLHVGDVVVRQVAGLIARRIVCDSRPGDSLARGEQFGMIKFGSRTELWIPKERVRDVCVKINDKVKGGETLLARIG